MRVLSELLYELFRTFDNLPATKRRDSIASRVLMLVLVVVLSFSMCATLTSESQVLRVMTRKTQHSSDKLSIREGGVWGKTALCYKSKVSVSFWMPGEFLRPFFPLNLC